MGDAATQEDPKEEEGEVKEEEDPRSLKKILREFFDSDDAKQSQELFEEIMEKIGENPENKKPYQLLTGQDDFPRVKTLCQTLDSRSNNSEFKKESRNSLKGKKVLVVGAGPCGLRAAIELALLDMEVHVVEKRDIFSRNSVLQLWLFLVEDLKRIGFKELLPKFGLGDRLHISIRRLQLVLMKIALLVGVQVHLGVEFIRLIEPKKKKNGWKPYCFNINRSEVDKALKDYEFEALVIGSGRQTEDLAQLGFEWVNIERKLAIAIAANFKNKNSRKDLQVDSTGTQGVMHQLDVFVKMKEAKGTDLENVVYLRDDTHYFVMTAKRENLLERGVLKEDSGKKTILEKSNIDQEKLQEFAKDVAAYCTEGKIDLEFFEKANGDPDVDIFEFTSRSHAKEAAVIKKEKGKKPLLIVLVGDSLKQPFWPEGVGIAHGFFGSFDSVWAVYEYLGEKLSPEEVLENRKEAYSAIKELSKESMLAVKDYGIDPEKRYGKYRHYKTVKEQEKNTPSTSKEGKTAKGDNTKPEGKTVKFDEDKKKKSKKEKKKTDEGEKKTSFFRRLFSWGGKKSNKRDDTDGAGDQNEVGKLKRSASADDIRDATDENPKQRPRRFDSLRRSFKRITPGKKKKKNKTEAEAEKVDGDVKNDKVNEEDNKTSGAVGVKHTSATEDDIGESSGPTTGNDVDIKVEVHDSS